MSRHSLVRALVFVLAGALVWTTVIPAEAKRPRRHSDPILEDWTNCKNGATLTIGANDDVRLVVTSRGRTLARALVRLRDHKHTIWVLNEVPDPGVVVIDNPDTDPGASDQIRGNEVQPEPADSRDKAATVKVWWRRPAGQTLSLGLASVTEPSGPVFATYRVENCVLLPGTWSESFDALRSWLWEFTPIFDGLRWPGHGLINK
jgi:hypothetical protein